MFLGKNKSYISFLGIALCLLCTESLLAQPMPDFTPYTPTSLYAWDNQFESYEYQSPRVAGLYKLRFRLRKPNGWTSTPSSDKYPLIVFLHGSGESSGGDMNVQNNSKQLLHGGQTHLNAVINGVFPGFLLYPQMRRTGVNCGEIDPETGLPDYSTSACPNNNWAPEWREEVRYIIDKLILDYKVDPDRIYIHGLSGGGAGTWQLITDYPEYFAAAHPMSAAGDQFHTSVFSGEKEYYKHVPIWSAQGALDTSPPPSDGNQIVTAIRDIGGSIRYSYYTNLGHGTWNSEYAQPDFFSWFLARKKNQIFVFYEQPLACPGDPVNVRLGFTKTIYPNGRGSTLGTGDYGFGAVGNRQRIINYEWARGNTSTVVASGATLNEIQVTTAGPYTPGTYYGRFQRADGSWSAWSDPVLVNDSRGPSTSPTISPNGKSTTLPALDGGTEVLLVGTSALAAYQWKKDGTNITNATEYNYAASQHGFYTLISKDPAGSPYQFDVVPTVNRAPTQGCFSLPSNSISVTTSNGLDVPAPPGNFFVSSNSQNSIVVSWDDRSDDENGFEIYRSLASGSGYSLVTIVPATSAPNPQTYVDNNLQPNTMYYYRMRSVNASGGSAYTQVASASTNLDVVAPTAPVLTVPGTLRSTVLLQWSGATDNVAITGYDVYQNGSIIASVNGTTTYFEAKNLVPLSVYNYYVRARDLAGNTSPPSNQLAATARNSGLLYKYYHHNDLTSTVEIPAVATLNKIGFISSFSTSPRTQNDRYAFVYEGFINLPSSGSYRFSTNTDEGSRMWVNNQLVVDNDGTQVCTKVTSAPTSLSSGWVPVRLEYFENTNTECFTIRWTLPGANESNIPSSAFSESAAGQPSVSSPSNFRSTLVAYNQIALAWNDNSNNETGFEIYRLKSNDGSGTYQVINVTAANANTWIDNTVEPGTRYYYRIRAINATNISSLVNMNSPGYVITPAAPAPPAIPGSLTATPISATQINLTWGNVSGETGFELQKSSSSSGGFTTIETFATDITAYSDNSVTGHSTFYYRIRSLSVGGVTSDWSVVASATTPNRNPVITDIPNQSILQLSGTPQVINISVSDPDNDPISFQFTGLPNTYVFTTNNYGQGTLSFTNVAAGTYNITVQGSDGIANVSDNFVLTVGNNQAPVISALTLDGTAVTPAPITTVQNQSMEAGRRFVMAFTIQDPDGNATLTAPIVSNLPPFASGAWTGTGNNNRIYTLTFNSTISTTGFFENINITFRDASGGTNSQTFSLIVNPVDPNFKIYVNFGSNPATDTEALPWNNSVTFPPAGGTILSNLKDELGVTVKYVRFNIPNNWDVYPTPRNSLPADPNAIYTKTVRESYLRKLTGGANGDSRTFTFTNLNPALQYRVTAFASFPGTVQNGGLTIFTVTGTGNAQQLAPLNPNNNTSETRTSDYKYPNAAGQLLINVKVSVGNSYFHINSLVLEATYLENAPPPTPIGLALESPLNNRVNVSWQDNSFNETGFRIYRSTSANGTYTQVGEVAANIVTFADLTTVGRTTYYYKVSSFNAFGESALSAHALITTPNGIPVVSNPGTVVVTSGQLLQTNINAVDPENDPMTFSVSGLPSFASIIDNGNGTGFIRFTPTAADIGAYQLTLNVVDAYSGSSETPFSLVVSDAEVNETVYINFTASTSSNALAPWNNILSSPSALLNNTGVTSTMSIARSGTWVTSDNVGVSTGANTGLYADRVLQSGWTVNSTGTSTTLTLSGLDNAKRYNISILGSRNEFWFANAIYRINTGTPFGASTDKTLNTRKNTNRVVRFVGIAPSNNTIVISVRRDATIEYTSTPPATPITIEHRDATINAMVVEAYTPGVPRTPSNLVALAESKTNIRLTWFDNSSNETGFEIQRATDPEGPFTTIATTAADIDTYNNTSLNPNTAYVYRVRAVKTSAPASQSLYSTTAIASTFDKIVLVNVNGNAGGGALQAPAPWNNLNQEPGNIAGPEGFLWSNFNDDINAPTTVDLQVNNYTGGGSRSDRGYSAAGDVYPYNVMMTNYLYNANSGSDWTLQELDPNAAYDLVFFGTEWEAASRAKNGEKVVSEFVVGPIKQSIYNPKNNKERAFFYNVIPEEDSTIFFQAGAAISATEVITAGFFNSLELRSYTPINAAFDKIAPSVPQNLVASNIASDSLRLTWSASTDNVRVAGYEIFKGSDLIATIAGTTFRVTGLQPSTAYTFSVRAKDVKGNLSGFSNAIQATTLNAAGAIPYYPNAGGDITLTSTWGVLIGGAGAHPATFAANNQHFILDRDASINTALNLTGSNTKLIVLTGIDLTINQPVTGQIDVGSNATLVINSPTSPQLGTLAVNSTVTFQGTSNTIPGASYGNLSLEGTTSTKTFNTGNYVVNGNLTFADDVTVNGAAGNGTMLNVSGNLTLEGNLTAPVDNQLFSLNFTGGGTQNIFMSTENELRLFQLNISNNSELNVVEGATAKTITVGTATGGGLTIANGATLDIGNNNLDVRGAGAINSANETGQLSVSKATLFINSTGSQISNMYFKTDADTISNLHLNAHALGQVNVLSTLYVKDVVDVTSGRLNSAGNLVLVSDINGSAIVSKIGTTGSFLGAVQYQRYLSPKRVYRYMGAPVFSSRISDWQVNMSITGPFEGSSGSTSPSLFYYDESSGGWTEYPGSFGTNAAQFEMGRGYSIYQYNGSTPSKLQISGTLQQGNFNYTNLTPGTDAQSNDGWNLVSNVYASPIQWGNSGWVLNDIGGTVSVRNNLNATQGGFKVWNNISGGDEDFGGVITQGQSFWVKSTGSNPSLQITEDAKVSVPNAVLYRETPGTNQIAITLKNSLYTDRTFLHFSDYSSDDIEETLDALKKDNTYFNLSSRLNNTDLAINSMTLNFCEKLIPLNVRNIGVGHYSFDFTKLETFNFEVEATLMDKYTNTTIHLREGSRYEFDVTTDPASLGLNRFELLLKKPEIDQSITFVSTAQSACETNEGIPVLLSTSQRGVQYAFMSNGKLIGNAQGTGSALEAILNGEQLGYGENNIQISAKISGCQSVELSSTTTLTYQQTFKPTVSSPNICSGENALIEATGAPNGAKYNWYEDESATSPVFSSEHGNFNTPALLKSKNYFVSSVYGNCESQRSEIIVQVDHLDKPSIQIAEGELVSSSSDGNQWMLNGNIIPGATSQTYIPEQTGDYSTMVTSGACTQISDAIIFTVTGVEKGQDFQIKLYPNPTKNTLHILISDRLSTRDTRISILSSQGRLVNQYTKPIRNNTVEMDVKELAPGLYTVLIELDGATTQKRFIKE